MSNELDARSEVAEASRALRDARRLYDEMPRGIRAFVTLRHWLAPLARVLAVVPPAGRILDVGCGHGLFSAAMALGSAARDVSGVDPSPAKIDVAAKVGARVPNLRFRRGTVANVADRDFDAITVLDVLYLLPREEKVALLSACRDRLAPGGRLVLKTNDTRPAWKFAVTRAQEALMTRVGLTMGHGALHFFSRRENRDLLVETGFEVDFVDLNSWLPYPHVMFVGRRR